NLTAASSAAKTGTNSSSGPVPGTAATNSTPTDVAKGAAANSIRAEIPIQTGTNPLVNQTSKAPETNGVSSVVAAKAATNPPVGQMIAGSATNSATTQVPERKGTNTLADQGSAKKGTNLNARSGLVPPAAAKPPEIPPPIQARIDRVYQSEILGTVMRPLPMALLGIAGNVAFLRAANGQTGMVKEGDSLGGIKLIRIGVNRVLIEHEGQSRELTIFSGFGSETLLQKTKEPSNETLTKTR
ncbi:MAG: hypothetical protein H7X97_06980, partial [Opitutaceae bacterium]|nr:hypothetical protein [Verrucomicrobiales bacterium]